MTNFKLKVLVMAVVLLQGCAFNKISPDEYEAFIAKDETARNRGDVTMPIEVIAVEDALLFCSTKFNVAHSAACSRRSTRAKECTIVISKGAPAVVVGHEFRHCFEGAFH